MATKKEDKFYLVDSSGVRNAKFKFWKEFPLKAKEQEQLVREIKDAYTLLGNDGARQDWCRKRKIYEELYNQKRKQVSSVFGSWAFLHFPLPAMFVDKVHSHVFNSMAGTEKFVTAIGTNRANKIVDDDVTDWMSFQLKHKCDLESVWDSTGMDVWISGVGWMSNAWQSEIVTHFTVDKSGKYIWNRTGVENVSLRYIPTENVLLSPDAKYNGVQNCEFIIEKQRRTWQEIKSWADQGVFVNLEKTAIGKDDSPNADIAQKTDADRSGVSTQSDGEVVDEVIVLEVTKRFQYQDKPIADWKFWVSLKDGKLLRWHPQTLPCRPYVRFACAPLRQSLYPMGIVEKLDSLSLELDTIYNQMLQVAALNISPPVFIDPASQLDVDKSTWGPNCVIKVINPRENIYFPTPPTTQNASLTIANDIFQAAQRFMSISDYGMGMGGSETATGVSALTKSMMSNLSSIMFRIKKSFEELSKLTYRINQQFATKEQIYAYCGDTDKANLLYDKLKNTAGDPSAEYDFIFEPDLFQFSELKRNEMTQILQTVMPVLMQIPQGSMPPNIYAMLREYLETVGHSDLVKKILGPAPAEDFTNLTGLDAGLENQMMQEGEYPHPSEKDNPQEHITLHGMFAQSEFFPQLDTKAKGLFIRHMRESQAVYGKMMNLSVGQMPNLPDQGPNMVQPGTNNPQPMPPQQMQNNMENLNGRIEQGNPQMLGANQ